MQSDKLLCVAPRLVDQLWPHVETLIERALIKSDSDLSIADVRRRVNDGAALLWIIWSETYRGKPIPGYIAAAGTTEISGLPDGRRVCIITNCAGRNLKQWDRFLSDIEAYAKQERCVAVRCYGRRGWVRYLRDRGYSEPWVVVEKKVA